METTIEYSSLVTDDKFFEIRKREYKLEERADKIKIEMENTNIKKVESLLDLLESTVPTNDNPIGDKYNYISIFTEDELEIIKIKLFTVIEKY